MIHSTPYVIRRSWSYSVVPSNVFNVGNQQHVTITDMLMLFPTISASTIAAPGQPVVANVRCANKSHPNDKSKTSTVLALLLVLPGCTHVVKVGKVAGEPDVV